MAKTDFIGATAYKAIKGKKGENREKTVNGVSAFWKKNMIFGLKPARPQKLEKCPWNYLK